MLTNNKAVYGTDGSLKTLKDMGGGHTSNQSVEFITDEDTILNVFVGTDRGPVFTNLEYNHYYRVIVWLLPDEGYLTPGIIYVRKLDKNTMLQISTNDIDDRVNITALNAGDNSFDLSITGGISDTIIYYEFLDFEEVD